jgi:hypothetical protein
MVITDQKDQGAPPGTSISPRGGGTAGSNLYQQPYTTGTPGKGLMVPTTLPLGVNGCTVSGEVTSSPAACSNNGATFGSVTGVIGSQRLMTMDLHINF